MGADRAVHLVIDDLPFAEGFVVASLLEKLVSSENIDMLFMGKQAVDDDQNQVPSMLAALLGWPQANNVIKLDFSESSVRATREAEGGRRELLELQKPFVVGLTKGINEPRYPALKGIMAAKKKEIKAMSVDELGIDIDALRTFTVRQYSLPPERGEVKMLEGDVEEAADELVRLLPRRSKGTVR